MEILEFTCDESNIGTRIDKFISIEGITRSRIQKLVSDGCVTVNGKR